MNTKTNKFLAKCGLADEKKQQYARLFNSAAIVKEYSEKEIGKKNTLSEANTLKQLASAADDIIVSTAILAAGKNVDKLECEISSLLS